MNIVIIAALSTNGVIGNHGQIPWHISDDLKRFKRLTMGHAIIMGRKTYESIGRPLPGRTNIVLTRNQSFQPPEAVQIYSSLGDALDACRRAGETTAYVIGGGEIYREALPVTDILALTHVHREVQGDAHFPSFERAQWTETNREDHPEYSYVEYRRRAT
jgi:dihydrofolate reductase